MNIKKGIMRNLIVSNNKSTDPNNAFEGTPANSDFIHTNSSRNKLHQTTGGVNSKQ
jgi:hypothetical protein